MRAPRGICDSGGSALARFRSRSRRLGEVALLASAYRRVDLAALDEFHQTFVSSRTGTLQDVMIDCGGAILGLALRFGSSTPGHPPPPRRARPSRARSGRSSVFVLVLAACFACPGRPARAASRLPFSLVLVASPAGRVGAPSRSPRVVSFSAASRRGCAPRSRGVALLAWRCGVPAAGLGSVSGSAARRSAWLGPLARGCVVRRALWLARAAAPALGSGVGGRLRCWAEISAANDVLL